MLIKVGLVLIVAATFGIRPASAQQVTKPTVAGAMNFAKLETTVACGGATTPEAVPESEDCFARSSTCVCVEAAPTSKACRSGEDRRINFYNSRSASGADPKLRAFPRTVTDKNNEPAYIHCARRQPRLRDVDISASSSITGPRAVFTKRPRSLTAPR